MLVFRGGGGNQQYDKSLVEQMISLWWNKRVEATTKISRLVRKITSSLLTDQF
jgi:hypothetical protein